MSVAPIGLIVGVFCASCAVGVSFVFLGDVRRLELSPCNSRRERQRPGNAMERKSMIQAEVMKIEQNTAIVAT